ncbi:hypothetical protein [Methylocystis sp.]|uniref:hypothetical protein n=1 Tax=Methylocystis sp. TaxID=1911079 RepID=UPI003D0C1FC2
MRALQSRVEPLESFIDALAHASKYSATAEGGGTGRPSAASPSKWNRYAEIVELAPSELVTSILAPELALRFLDLGIGPG